MTTNKFLFIMCAPFSGSTLLHEIICTSQNVSANNTEGSREGQTLPEVREIMFTDKRFNPDLEYPWDFIKEVWMKYWNTSKLILLEKSPSNIVRALTIEKNFTPSFFLIMVRNPYAHCESLISRNKWDAKLAASFALRCLRIQKQNIESLTNQAFFTYEQLVCEPETVKNQIVELVPELYDISLDGKFNAHNFRNENLPVTNLNIEKIKKLTPEQLVEINKQFKNEVELFAYYGYELIEN